MKKIILITLLLLVPTITYWNNVLDSLSIWVKWKYYNGYELYLTIDNKINKYTKYNLEKKKEIYKKLLKQINLLNTTNHNKNLNNIEILIKFWHDNVLKKLKTNYSKTQKITLWYTEKWYEIIAYYKWNPKDGYFWVFANIHGWYEYWTYNTALYLIDEFEKSWKTWRFIIPTINPEWLEYYFKYKNRSYFYNKWRVNSNNVDINRNFCTSDFNLTTFIKNWEYFQTWINNCNSENETNIIIKTLKKYKFNKVLSMHSQWKIIYIPNNSIDDKKISIFWKEIQSVIPNYEFDINYKTNYQKRQKVEHHEIDEWWKWIYTWTMENYIYEKYNIPVILLELYDHWKLEYNLKNLTKYLRDN